jgi:hypothetical protein
LVISLWVSNIPIGILHDKPKAVYPATRGIDFVSWQWELKFKICQRSHQAGKLIEDPAQRENLEKQNYANGLSNF